MDFSTYLLVLISNLMKNGLNYKHFMKLCHRIGSVLTTVPYVVENKMQSLIWGYLCFM